MHKRAVYLRHIFCHKATISDQRALYILPAIHKYPAKELMHEERYDLRSSDFSDGRARVCSERQGVQKDRVRCTVTCACIHACARAKQWLARTKSKLTGVDTESWNTSGKEARAR